MAMGPVIWAIIFLSVARTSSQATVPDDPNNVYEGSGEAGSPVIADTDYHSEYPVQYFAGSPDQQYAEYPNVYEGSGETEYVAVEAEPETQFAITSGTEPQLEAQLATDTEQPIEETKETIESVDKKQKPTLLDDDADKKKNVMDIFDLVEELETNAEIGDGEIEDENYANSPFQYATWNLDDDTPWNTNKLKNGYGREKNDKLQENNFRFPLLFELLEALQIDDDY